MEILDLELERVTHTTWDAGGFILGRVGSTFSVLKDCIMLGTLRKFKYGKNNSRKCWGAKGMH